MPETTDPQPDRIPIGRLIVYAVRGMPDVPNQYGPGSLAPTEITLTYRSTEDSQLGRIHAYVKGRWRCDGDEAATDLPLPGQHYYGDPAGWPDWLAIEARLHDPAPAAPVPPSTPTGRAELRDRIAALFRNPPGVERLGDATPGEIANAVLAVIPEPVGIDPPHVRAARYAAAGNEMAASLVRDGFGDDEIAAMLNGSTDEVTPARHTCHDRATAAGPDWQCPRCSTLPSRMAVEAPAPSRAGGETQQGEAEAHPPSHAWKVESPRRGQWAHWFGPYDDHDWVRERYQDAVEVAPGREFRIVRETTTYTVELPTAVSQPGKEA
ncbi:hypothetical protein ACFRFU_19475 [Streptomyces sp. NPDC056704]|uniref:hypothetical protein n=1 Tax=Streptomyces sp. NPDC056704 TaxID=3345917 RepID=UPI0036C9EE78